METGHKRKDTPILRDRVTKKRLLAYELHIKTHELSVAESRQLRDENRGLTPELRTRSLPIEPTVNLQKVLYQGRELYVRAEDLGSPDATELVTPSENREHVPGVVTPNASRAAELLLNLKPQSLLGPRHVSCPEPQTQTPQNAKPS